MGVRVEGAREAADDTRAIAGRMRDLEPALVDEARALDAMITQAFAEDAGPDGTRWAPRKTTTTARPGRRARLRSRREGRAALLERTGTLKTSTHVRIEDGAVVVESTAPYAGFVHAGTEHMPARPFLPLDRDGAPAQRGAAGAWWAGFAARLADFVVGGRRAR